MSQIKKIGKYYIKKQIASGGMATLYEAHSLGLHGFTKRVALKQIKTHHDPEIVQALIQEAQIMTKLTHDNIVTVHELNQEDDNVYLVLEYIDGVDLRTLLKYLKQYHHRLSAQQITYLAIQLAQALEAIHNFRDENIQESIIHRDISPHNILVSHNGHVKLTDFGIAKGLKKTEITRTGIIKGKISYLSPEQINKTEITPQSDLFSLGLVLYECATLTKLFTGDSDAEVLSQITAGNYKVTLPNDPEYYEINSVIQKCLQYHPENRYKSAEHILDDIASKSISDIGRTKKELGLLVQGAKNNKSIDFISQSNEITLRDNIDSNDSKGITHYEKTKKIPTQIIKDKKTKNKTLKMVLLILVTLVISVLGQREIPHSHFTKITEHKQQSGFSKNDTQENTSQVATPAIPMSQAPLPQTQPSQTHEVNQPLPQENKITVRPVQKFVEEKVIKPTKKEILPLKIYSRVPAKIKIGSQMMSLPVTTTIEAGVIQATLYLDDKIYPTLIKTKNNKRINCFVMPSNSNNPLICHE